MYEHVCITAGSRSAVSSIRRKDASPKVARNSGTNRSVLTWSCRICPVWRDCVSCCTPTPIRGASRPRRRTAFRPVERGRVRRRLVMHFDQYRYKSNWPILIYHRHVLHSWVGRVDILFNHAYSRTLSFKRHRSSGGLCADTLCSACPSANTRQFSRPLSNLCCMKSQLHAMCNLRFTDIKVTLYYYN